MSDRTFQIRQVRSSIGFGRAQQATLRGLGLRKTGSTSTVKDTPEIRGMLRKVSHLISVEETR